MSTEKLRAHLALLEQMLAESRARAERPTAWYAAQFDAQLAERQTSLVVIRPELEAA
jgi:hypothetical protein